MLRRNLLNFFSLLKLQYWIPNFITVFYELCDCKNVEIPRHIYSHFEFICTMSRRITSRLNVDKNIGNASFLQIVLKHSLPRCHTRGSWTHYVITSRTIYCVSGKKIHFRKIRSHDVDDRRHHIIILSYDETVRLKYEAENDCESAMKLKWSSRRKVKCYNIS